MWRGFLCGLLCVVLFAGICGAGSPVRTPVSFSTTWDVGVGRSVYVVGGHADLGNWDPAESLRLYWTSGNVWTGQVAVQAGSTVEYKFIARTNTSGTHCTSENAEWASGGNLTCAVPAQPSAPYTGKTIYYHSDWTNAFIRYRSGEDWIDVPMTNTGQGRTPGEFLYCVGGVGEVGEPIEFVPNGYLGGTHYWDNTTDAEFSSNYYSTLDTLFIQDTNVYNYRPPATVGVSRVVTTYVNSSWAPTIPSRYMKIYLPRGYDTNTWKRYPVLYMHDGQNCFYPGGSFGSWDADLTADREIAMGRMRETIIVAVDNTSERMREYMPPGDDAGFGAGTGDQYGNFLIHNVRPTIDTTYRTRNDPDNTLVMGSSLGGLISAYLGFETNVYGKAAPMSPSFWAATNLVGRIDSNDVKGIRVYMDLGTDEGSSMWDPTWEVYALLQQDGYAPNNDLLTVVGCGQDHNEAAWASRLRYGYRFLLSLWDEENLLSRELTPLHIADVAFSVGADTLSVDIETLQGFSYMLQRRDSLISGDWSDIGAATIENRPWNERTLDDTNAPSSQAYYRIQSNYNP